MKKLLIIILLALPLTVMAGHSVNTSVQHDGDPDHSNGQLTSAEPSHPREEEINLLFNWLEVNFSTYFPSHQDSFYNDGYITRYYPGTDGYLYAKGDELYFYNYGKPLIADNTLGYWLYVSGIITKQAYEKGLEDARNEAARKEEERQEEKRRMQEFRDGIAHDYIPGRGKE